METLCTCCEKVNEALQTHWKVCPSCETDLGEPSAEATASGHMGPRPGWKNLKPATPDSFKHLPPQHLGHPDFQGVVGAEQGAAEPESKKFIQARVGFL